MKAKEAQSQDLEGIGVGELIQLHLVCPEVRTLNGSPL